MTVARRLLFHVALGVAFVVAVVTAVTSALVYDALKRRDRQHLTTYLGCHHAPFRERRLALHHPRRWRRRAPRAARRSQHRRDTFIFLTAKGEKGDQRAGMNLGADDDLTKPVSAPELLGAIAARLARESKRSAGFAPDFSSSTPLEALGLTPREGEVLRWVAQGKSDPEIATI